MSDLQRFKTAVIEALSPHLRDAIHGRSVNEDEVQADLKYQLENRGFSVDDDDE